MPLISTYRLKVLSQFVPLLVSCRPEHLVISCFLCSPVAQMVQLVSTSCLSLVLINHRDIGVISNHGYLTVNRRTGIKLISGLWGSSRPCGSHCCLWGSHFNDFIIHASSDTHLLQSQQTLMLLSDPICPFACLALFGHPTSFNFVNLAFLAVWLLDVLDHDHHLGLHLQHLLHACVLTADFANFQLSISDTVAHWTSMNFTVIPIDIINYWFLTNFALVTVVIRTMSTDQEFTLNEVSRYPAAKKCFQKN